MDLKQKKIGSKYFLIFFIAKFVFIVLKQSIFFIIIIYIKTVIANISSQITNAVILFGMSTKSV